MVCALVLAAGRSRRMGTQKLLLPVGGQPMIARVVDELLRSPVDEVVVVTGHEGERIAKALARPLAGSRCPAASSGFPRVRFVANPRPESEMLDSVRCGLAAMPEECAGVLVALGDQPAIRAEVVAALVRAFRAAGRRRSGGASDTRPKYNFRCGRVAGRGIVVPTCGGRRGHPLLFAMHYRDEIATRYDEVGLRGLLQAHPEDVIEVEVAEPGVLEDIDAPEDYRRTVGER